MERNVRSRFHIHARTAGWRFGATDHISIGRLMEQLPVKVIGDILSCIGAARDVVRASLTCRKWREAYRKHLRTLSFNADDDKRVYHELPTISLEALITRTIFQTTGLRKLSILMDDKHKFSAATVLGWLMFTRNTLCELIYKVNTSPNIDLLHFCGSQKLEVLSLSHYSIGGVEPNLQGFSCLRSLCLTRVCILVSDLNRFLKALPNIEYLELNKPILQALDEEESDSEDDYEYYFEEEEECITVSLNCPTLKTLFLKDLDRCGFILRADGIEYLHMKSCSFDLFKLIGKRSLKHVKIYHVEVEVLDIGEMDNLETLDISMIKGIQLELFPMNMRAPKLKRLRLWGFIDVYGDTIDIEKVAFPNVDFERIAACSPELSHLSIFCDINLPDVKYCFGGASSLENVVVLELGCDVEFAGYGNRCFWKWADDVLKCCRNVRKLIVHCFIPDKKSPWFCEDLATHSSSMVAMMKKYLHVDVRFVYSYASELRSYFDLKDSSN